MIEGGHMAGGRAGAAPAGAPRLVLASASPRRRQLLATLGVPAEVDPADVDEARLPGEAPDRYVLRLAGDKAERVWARRGGSLPVLAADTAVIVDDCILGKPADAAEAGSMLRALSGRTHRVLTGVALRSGPGLETRLCTSLVSFRELGRAEIDAYWASGEPADKAGAYAIQGYGGAFVERIEGSWSGIVGLPLCETWRLLHAAGVGPAP
jgi:septum formation protein